MTALLDAPAQPATQVSALLRLATAGSVDDGKSTLVGRLLYDTKSVLADQYEAVERTSRDRGLEEADLALLTDGLRSERAARRWPRRSGTRGRSPACSGRREGAG